MDMRYRLASLMPEVSDDTIRSNPVRVVKSSKEQMSHGRQAHGSKEQTLEEATGRAVSEGGVGARGRAQQATASWHHAYRTVGRRKQ